MQPSSPFDRVPLPRRSPLLAYAVTLAALGLATVVTGELRPYTNQTVFLVPFVGVVLFAAWFGGATAGLVATGLSFLLNDFFFAEPFYTLRMDTDDLSRLLTFVVTCVLLVFLLDARNRAVRLLHEQREWLLVTMSSAGDALVVTNASGRVVFVNTVAEELLQVTGAEIQGRPLADVFHIVNEQTRERVDDPVAKVLRLGRMVGLANHTVLIAPDGREIPIDDSAAPVKDSEGATRGVVLLFRDVTERRRVERLLADQAERLRQQATLAEQALDPIFARSLQREIVFWNRAAEETYGWSREEATGANPHELLKTDFGQPVEEVERTVREQGVWNGELVHTCRDGRRIVEESRHVLVRDEAGDGRVILEINHDITDRRRAETEREQALAEAREANRLKDDFLSTLSHELRTPLNAILGWSQILLQPGLDDETQRRAIRTIARNAEAQNQLIADVLDVSRIVSGKMRLSVQPVDLARLALDAIDSVRPAAEAKGITLRQRVEGPSLWVSADPARLQQILWNLLSNALKFTPKGGEVGLEVLRVESRVRMRVTDTGAGITRDFLPRVFERFSQRDSSTSRTQGGLGLGLAIVRHLAEAHGGGVTAESAGENQGATFTVTLPVRAVTSPSEDARTSPAPGDLPDVDILALANLRVLVVDDEADARDLVKEVLSRHGAHVRTADSARAAVEELQREHYDLLIADIGMPGEDGYSLIRQVRSLPAGRGREVTALAVTAYGRPEDRLRALAVGFQQHLAKPVAPGELLVVAASLFQGRSAAQEEER